MCWFIILGISEGLHFLITAVFFQSMFNYLYSKRGECRRAISCCLTVRSFNDNTQLRQVESNWFKLVHLSSKIQICHLNMKSTTFTKWVNL